MAHFFFNDLYFIGHVLEDLVKHEYKLSAWIVAFRPQTFNEIIKNPSVISELGFNKLTVAREDFEPPWKIRASREFQNSK